MLVHQCAVLMCSSAERHMCACTPGTGAMQLSPRCLPPGSHASHAKLGAPRDGCLSGDERSRARRERRAGAAGPGQPALGQWSLQYTLPDNLSCKASPCTLKPGCLFGDGRLRGRHRAGQALLDLDNLHLALSRPGPDPPWPRPALAPTRAGAAGPGQPAPGRPGRRARAGGALRAGGAAADRLLPGHRRRARRPGVRPYPTLQLPRTARGSALTFLRRGPLSGVSLSLVDLRAGTRWQHLRRHHVAAARRCHPRRSGGAPRLLYGRAYHDPKT